MNPNHPNVGTVGHIDNHSMNGLVAGLYRLPPPSHWPPRLTRMALAVRMGTTRMLLERRP